jgi:hypothetical protein
MSGKLTLDLWEYAAVCKELYWQYAIGRLQLPLYVHKLGRANLWPKMKFVRFTEYLLGSPC